MIGPITSNVATCTSCFHSKYTMERVVSSRETWREALLSSCHIRNILSRKGRFLAPEQEE